MIKRIYLILIGWFICNNVLSQTEPMSVVQKINQIKKLPDEYIYAEGTSKNWDEALDNAKTLLASYIEVWAKSATTQDRVDGYVAKANEHIFEIKAMRGQLYRAFVYVKKSDMTPYTKGDKLMIVPVQQESEVQVALLSPDSTEVEAVKLPHEKEDNHPLASEQPATDLQIETKGESITYAPSHEEQRMLQVKQANQINDFIREMQAENRIASLGKYNALPTDKDCYLFIYDKEGNLPAHLHKKNGKYFNMDTATQDDIANYKGCGAFWFILR